MRIEAKTLEDAYYEAAKKLNCSVTDLDIKIIQNPSKGLFGLFAKNAIIEILNSNNNDSMNETIQNSQSSNDNEIINQIDIDKAIEEIKKDIKNLFDKSCFNLDTFEVTKYNEETIFIRIDGVDAALLIGKEGYRYNALNYMLYSWINQKYGFKVRVEIAEFLKNQEEMLRNFLSPFIEKVKQRGYGKTKPFDGILSFIALEILREEFPNKYVAIKDKNGEKYVVIGDFNENYSSNSDA